MKGREPTVTGEYGNLGKPLRTPHLAKATAPGAVAEAITPSMVLQASAPAPPPEASAASTLPKPGDRIGQYEIIRELGQGGMGAVYAARDTKLGRKIAIKVLSSNDQPELTARFVIEAKATAQCSHENIIVIYEVCEHRENPFMVLEFLQGSSDTVTCNGKKMQTRFSASFPLVAMAMSM